MVAADTGGWAATTRLLTAKSPVVSCTFVAEALLDFGGQEHFFRGAGTK